MFEFRSAARLLGPLFDWRSRRAAARMTERAEQAIAQHGVNLIEQRLNEVLRTQTPYYRTMIQTERVHGDLAITDGGVVYGPWLEGVSERNKTTRFKGYGTFRRVHRQLQLEAPEIAERIVTQYVRDME